MKMRKFCLLSATACMIAGSIFFTGCSKDKDGSGGSTFKSITAKVVDGKDYDSLIDEVIAVIVYDDGDEGAGFAVESGPYKNGGFTIDFPESVSSKYLDYIFDDPEEGVKVSDEKTQGAILFFSGYSKSGEWVGLFNHEKETKTSYSEAEYLYVDRNCTVKGTEKDGKYTYTYDVSLKKGWNIIYYTETDLTETYSSKNPGGLEWYFYDSDNFKSYQMESAIRRSAIKSSLGKSKLLQKINFNEITK